MWVPSLGQEDPLEEGMPTSPVFLSGKSHGQKSLAGYSLCGHKTTGHDLATKQESLYNSLPMHDWHSGATPRVADVLLF